MTKVKNFKRFMEDEVKSGAVNESEFANEGAEEGTEYGANPEEEMPEGVEELEGGEELEGEEGEEGEEEPLTLEDVKAMLDDLTERVVALEPDVDPDAEGEEGEEGEIDPDAEEEVPEEEAE